MLLAAISSEKEPCFQSLIFCHVEAVSAFDDTLIDKLEVGWLI
jgi:hypothetical protein